MVHPRYDQLSSLVDGIAEFETCVPKANDQVPSCFADLQVLLFYKSMPCYFPKGEVVAPYCRALQVCSKFKGTIIMPFALEFLFSLKHC
jgi:hypothetical protein